MTTHPTVADVVAALEVRYPPRWADEGDAIGLIVGDPAASVEHVLFAVDPVQQVVDEAITSKADLIVVHHPLLFRAVNTVAADRPKGKVIHDLISHGIALYVAHTNADSPPDGVSESMAHALGLGDLRPLVPDPADPLDKLVTFVPNADAQRVIDALTEAGAGAIGDYDRCAFLAQGEGTFRPGPAANPTLGSTGEIEVVAETRLEMVLSRGRRDQVVAALRSAHPYEEPAFDVVELAEWAGDRGSGRVGTLEQPMTLRGFADAVAAALPATAVGARVSGDLDRQVENVALAGGAGDFLLDDARLAGVDVFVTSDLRHHPASEFREYDGPALIDVPHWAAEWTWLPVIQRVLTGDLAADGREVRSTVSRICTDPWNYRASSTASSPEPLDRPPPPLTPGVHPES
ncbi:MAG: Nif3-like dinuclear metal center hexameric protein [Nocardioidaceae bacterium]